MSEEEEVMDWIKEIDDDYNDKNEKTPQSGSSEKNNNVKIKQNVHQYEKENTSSVKRFIVIGSLFALMVSILIATMIITSVFTLVINNYVTDNGDDADTLPSGIQKEEGILVYDTAIDFSDKGDENGSTWIGNLICGLDEEYSPTRTYRVQVEDMDPAIVKGSFELKKIDSHLYRILNMDVPDYNTLITDDAQNNMTSHSFQNVVVDNFISIGIVYEGATIGMSTGLESNFIYITKSSSPTFCNKVSISGVVIPYSVYDKINPFLDLDISESVNGFLGSVDSFLIDDSNIEVPDTVIIANDIKYCSSDQVKGDVLSVIRPEDISVGDYEILGVPVDEFQFLTDMIHDSSMSIAILGNVQNNISSANFDILFIPDKLESSDLTGVVTFNQVSFVTHEDIENVLNVTFPIISNIPDISEMLNTTDISNLSNSISVRVGVTLDTRPKVSEYDCLFVSDLWAKPSGSSVSVAAYFTVTRLSDMKNYFTGLSNVDSDIFMDMIFSMTNFKNPAFSIMVYNGENIIKPMNIHNISSLKNIIAFAIIPDTDDDALMMQGQINGVLYNIGEMMEIEYLDAPIIIADSYNIWDDVKKVSFSEVCSNTTEYVSRTENELMVEMEGYVVGTTIKTASAKLATINPLFEVFKYLPFDIGIYSFSMNMSKTMYHLPIVTIVHGQGDTYLGQYMKVRGWLKDQDSNLILNGLREEVLNSTAFPGFLRNFVSDYLQGNPPGNLEDYVFGLLSKDIGSFLNYYIEGLNEQILEYIDTIKEDLTTISNMINTATENIDSLIENELEEIISEAKNLREGIYNLNNNIAEEINSLMETIDSANDIFKWGFISIPSWSFLSKVNILLAEYGFSSGLTGWKEYVDENFEFLDPLRSSIDTIIGQLNSLKNDISNDNENIQSQLSQLVSKINSIGTEVESIFTDYIEENSADELINQLNCEFAGFLFDHYSFYKSLSNSSSIEMIGGYIMVYEILPCGEKVF